MEIVQIVPKLPPAISGVGDYAFLLARELRSEHDIHTRFIVCDPSWDKGPELEGFEVQKHQTQIPVDLERHLTTSPNPEIVLLHYVCYGYQKRGCPVWLIRGLERWKAKDTKRQLISMFHELYASGLPWQSSFWTSPIQKSLVRSLAIISDRCITNLKTTMCTLARMSSRPEKEFDVLPVFSNVGELQMPFDLHARKPRMVVFGSPVWRRQVYNCHVNALERACQALGLTQIVDIGVMCGDMPKLRVPIVQTGSLPLHELSQKLSDSRAGFFAYPTKYLGKSGIFAAYAAHGLVPITFATNSVDSIDGLRQDEHFIRFPQSSYDSTQVRNISRNVHTWYSSHCIHEQAVKYARLIRNGS